MSEVIAPDSTFEIASRSPELVQEFVDEMSDFLNSQLQGRIDLHERYKDNTPIGLAVAVSADYASKQIFENNNPPTLAVFANNQAKVGTKPGEWNDGRLRDFGIESVDDLPDWLQEEGVFTAAALAKTMRVNRDGSWHSHRVKEDTERFMPNLAGGVHFGKAKEHGSSVAVSGLWGVHDQIASHYANLALTHHQEFFGASEENTINRQTLFEMMMLDIEVSSVIARKISNGKNPEDLDGHEVGQVIALMEYAYLDNTVISDGSTKRRTDAFVALREKFSAIRDEKGNITGHDMSIITDDQAKMLGLLIVNDAEVKQELNHRASSIDVAALADASAVHSRTSGDE